MTQKTIPTQQQFLDFFMKLESIGFRRMTNEEIKEELSMKTSVSRIPQKGEGNGIRRQYLYEVDTIRCEINTNYSDAIGKAVERGFGKVVVKDSRVKLKLMSFDVRLGEQFLDTLFGYAKAYVDFINNWPFIADGSQRRFLLPIKGVMYEKYFVLNAKKQEGIYFLDIAMEEENKKFLQKMLDRHKNLKRFEEKNNTYRKPLPVLRKEKLAERNSTVADQSDSLSN